MFYCCRTSLFILFRIETDETVEGLLTDGTEVGLLVGAHTTVGLTAPDALGLIAATFDERSASLVDEVLPLLTEIVHGGEIGLPRFGIGEIHRVVLAIGVLVAKTAEGMTKLVNDHRLELIASGIAEIIGIIDASTAVIGGIGQRVVR